MHFHNAFEHAFGWIVARGGFHLCENIKVHSTSEIFFPAGDDDPFDGLIAQCVIHQCVKMQERLHIQHVHGFAGAIPCDGGDALAVFGHCKIGCGGFSHVLLQSQKGGHRHGYAGARHRLCGK